MPRVPRAEEQVREAALPGARFPTEAPAAAFGGGQAAAGASEAARGLAHDVAAFAQDERAAADFVVVQQADLETAKEKLRLLKDPKSGALNVRGQETLGLPDSVGGAFDKYTEGVRERLTAGQRTSYDRLLTGHKRDINDTLGSHIFSEMRKFDESTTNARLETAREEALLNFTSPEKVKDSINLQTDLIRKRADRSDLAGQSVPPEEVDRQIKEATSKTQASVINRFVNSGETAAAREYYKRPGVKESLTAADAEHVDKVMRIGTITGESQQRASELFRDNPGNQKVALELARKIEDPDIQEATVSKVKTLYNEDKELSARVQEDAMRLAIKITNNQRGLGAVPPGVLAQLSTGSNEIINNYANKVRTNTLQTDKPLYYGLKLMTVDPADREAFKNEDLTRYRADLEDAEYNELTSLQAAIKKDGGKSSEKALQGFRTETEIINTALNSINIDPTPKPGSDDSKKVAEFRSLVSQHLLTDYHGREATNQEVQKTVDRLTIETKKTGWFSKPRYAFQKAVKKSDVPRATIPVIEDLLRKARIPVNDDNVIEAYNRAR